MSSPLATTDVLFSIKIQGFSPDKKLRGLIIIPAHNEAASVAGVLGKLLTELPEGADVLVIDDGSSDETTSEVKSTGTPVCTLPCNLGYTNALRTGLLKGLQNEAYEWFAFMDADGQHRPQDIRNLIESFKDNPADLIIGSRWKDKNLHEQDIPAGRKIGMIFFAWLTQKLTGQRLTDTTSGMKIMNRSVAKTLLEHHFGDFHSEVIIYLHDRHYRLDEIPIIVHERQAGTSMYSLIDAVIYPWKNLILIAVFKLNSWASKKV